MAKTRIHHRRPGNQVSSSPELSAQLYDEDECHMHNGSHKQTCVKDDMSIQAVITRIVLIVILAATVATMSMCIIISVRRGPHTVLTRFEDVRSFFLGEDTGVKSYTSTTSENSKSKHPNYSPDVPKQKKSKMKSDTANTKEAKHGNSGADRTGTKLTIDDPEVKTQVPFQQPNGFDETILNRLKIRDITVDGRAVIGQELVGKKKRPRSASIRVYQFENFLSDYECDGLLAAHRAHVKQHSDNPLICFDSLETLQKHLQKTSLNIKVTSQDFTEGTSCVNASLSIILKSILGWSYSTAFYPGETRFTSIFDDRVYQATGLKPSHGGKYQITSYNKGIGYKTHTDCTIGNLDPRDRMGTILVYLQDVQGGQTEFPKLGISVTPRKGRAIVWNNQKTNGECDPYSLHVAQPVIKGQKVILQRWYYYKNFYMLGKRPTEPDIPIRNYLQPRVSCDEYDHGSCRWYDEWNYDHINEYRQIKSNLQ